MKAILWTQYGGPDVLQLREVDKPVPKDNQVLVRIRATTVTVGDCELRRLKLPFYYALALRLYVGFSKPTRITIPGTELAGEIESVGKDVTLFKPGDPVFGSALLSFGCYAEYKCLPEAGSLALKPSNMTYDEAAAVPFGGRDALHFLRKANIRSGQKVLINGAGGSIGSFAVQLAKHLGAEVTGVDSAPKLDMLRSIGADHVIDYAQEDFTRSGVIYDVIFDTVGKSPYGRSLRSLTENGYYLQANPGLSHRLRGSWTGMTSGRHVFTDTSNPKPEDLVYLRELIEAGQIISVIDRRYPLEQIAEAHRYVETGAKIGNVVITVGEGVQG